jgi:2-polyprenyl-6-hydroxyphenyl methylase/3-demethylubiquinone-9 3-methyltransferase
MRRNDLAQYDRLASQWWRPGGAFAMLHWLAAARARLIPAATRPGEVLVDLGCGGGVLSAYLTGKGYRHVGVDLVTSALVHAAAHRVAPVRADVTRLPLRDGCAAVVSAGELLEHVVDRRTTVAEACRILRPGGVLVLDTLNATLAARVIAVGLAERLGGRAVRGIHDADLFVDPRALTSECADHGVELRIRGVRPATGGLLRWLVTRRGDVTIMPSRFTAVLYQGRGVKHG